MLDTLSFDIVRRDPAASVGSDIGEWIAIVLPDGSGRGTMRGFVSGRFLRSPIDYRAIFDRRGRVWSLRAFLASD